MLMRKKIEYFFYNLRKQKSKNSIYFNLYFNKWNDTFPGKFLSLNCT